MIDFSCVPELNGLFRNNVVNFLNSAEYKQTHDVGFRMYNISRAGYRIVRCCEGIKTPDQLKGLIEEIASNLDFDYHGYFAFEERYFIVVAIIRRVDKFHRHGCVMPTC